MSRYYMQLICFFVLLSISVSNGCMGVLDPYSSGVVFNNNEQFYPDRIDSLGDENVSYFRDCMMTKVGSLENVIVVGPNVKVNVHTDPVTIKKVILTNTILDLIVTYGGGCTTHEFKLFAFEPIDKPTVNTEIVFKLSHNANGDACKSLITDTISFNIEPFKALDYAYPMYVNIFPPSDSFSKNVTKLLWYPGNSCSVKYRSHYFEGAMVYLDFYTPDNFTQFFPRMAIVVDPKIQFIKRFEYGKAVSTELKWLISQGVISGMTEKTISHITESMQNSQGQYWTLQDSLLGYNSWYTLEYKENGAWTWGTVVSTKNSDGCGFNVDFKLPPDSLPMVGTPAIKKGKSQKAHGNFSIRFAGGKYQFVLPQLSAAAEYIFLVDLKGTVLFRMPVPAGKLLFNLPFSKNISKGMYYAVYQGHGMKMESKLMVAE